MSVCLCVYHNMSVRLTRLCVYLYVQYICSSVCMLQYDCLSVCISQYVCPSDASVCISVCTIYMFVCVYVCMCLTTHTIYSTAQLHGNMYMPIQKSHSCIWLLQPCQQGCGKVVTTMSTRLWQCCHNHVNKVVATLFLKRFAALNNLGIKNVQPCKQECTTLLQPSDQPCELCRAMYTS